MKCPYCTSYKVREGSDFCMCNNPHCLHIWVKELKWKNKELVLKHLIENKEPQSIMSVARGVKSLKDKTIKSKGGKTNDKYKRRRKGI